jgi:hypothetical protein
MAETLHRHHVLEDRRAEFARLPDGVEITAEPDVALADLRVLRVARTIADLQLADLESPDLDGAICRGPEMRTGPRIDSIGPVHLAEALQLRRAVD